MKALLKTILYKPLFNILAFLIWITPGHSAAVGIILLTVILRLILIPSTKSTIVAQKKMKDLQPEIDRIKEEHKDDKQKQNMAIMQFYKANKINPLSSCLPALIQLPILIILYYVFKDGLTTERYADLLYSFTPHASAINTSFFWTDLSKPDHLLILPIIAGILQFIQARQMMIKNNKHSDKPSEKDTASDFQRALQNQTMYIMPLMTVIIAFRLPSALPLYWIITTAFMVLQQKFLLKDSQTNQVQVSIRKKES